MESYEAARAIFEDTVEGQSVTAATLAAELQVRAEQIREFQVGGSIDATRSDFVDALRQAEPTSIDALARHLEETARDVREVLGQEAITIADLPDGVAGQALQGIAGSSQVDVMSSVEGGAPGASLIDTTKLQDVVAHEARHEAQASLWNADVVEISSDALGRSVLVTRHDISEADAMLVQSTIADVSGDYKEIFRRMTSMFATDQIQRTAKSGDLQGLAEQLGGSIDVKPGITTVGGSGS